MSAIKREGNSNNVHQKLKRKEIVYSFYVVSLSGHHKKTSDAKHASMFRLYSHFSLATCMREEALEFGFCIPSQVVCSAKNYL
jgi:hypothetical protein